MNRRQFLAQLGFGTVAAAAAASGVLDLERLLWTPGERTIFLSPTARIIGPWLQKGDIFTIEGYYAFSEKTHQRLPFLKEWVATEDFTPTERDLVAGGPRIYPRIITTSGEYQNCARVGPSPSSWRCFHQLHGGVGVVGSGP